MLDAQAKPPSGIMEGNLNWIGDVAQCKSISAPGSKMWNIQFDGFIGKYCTARFNLGNISLVGGPAAVNPAYGLCLPNTCNFQGIDYHKLNQALLHLSENISSLHHLFEVLHLREVECLGDVPSPLSAGAIVVIVIYTLIALVVVLGTCLDYLRTRAIPANQDNATSINADDTDKEMLIHQIPEPSVATKILLCFSLKQHVPKVLSLESRQQDLACLHGIRVLSISWVVVGHTFFGFLFISNNVTTFASSLDDLPSELLLQAPLSVDSFFVLSGLLMTYLFMTQAHKMKINWPLFYIHRYLRLTPTYMLILAFWATLYHYLGNGPLWSNRTVDNCPSSWWQNLLYINNFYEISCMGWTWYLANDMQFFIISPLFLIPLKKKPKAGFAIIAALIIISWICTAIIVDYYNLSPMFNDLGGANITNMNEVMLNQQNAMKYIYTKPYCRIAPYLIGAATGYIVYWTRHVQEIALSKGQAALGWVLGAACLLIPIFAIFHAPHSKFISISFMMWHRSCWALGLCWVIFACLTGHGGLVNKFLSLRHWLPLSRLTYCLYLIHLIVIFAIFSSFPNTLPYSPTMVLVFTGGYLGGCYMLSLIATLFLESPIMALEKWALGRTA